MILQLIILGIVAGVLSGLLGIGGGVLIVPILIMAFGLSPHMAIGISIAVIVPTAFVGFLRHFNLGHVDFLWALYLALGAVVGAYLGASLTDYLSGHTLKRIFGVVLIAIGMSLVLGKEQINKPKVLNNHVAQGKDSVEV